MSTALEIVQQKKECVFVPFGSNEEIKLNATIIRKLCAKPATNGEEIDDDNAMKFMMLCRARALNPFEGDAWPVGYFNSKTQRVEWSLITAHNAFLKRAEANHDYEGMKSGVIIWPPMQCKPCKGTAVMKGEKGEDVPCKYCDGKGETDELEGDFVPHENKNGDKIQLVGGWARVFRKGRIPTYRRLAVAVFEKPYGQWLTNKAGMIVKCSEADALRSTFPTLLGSMYIEPGHSTSGDIDITSEIVEGKRPELPPGPKAPAAKVKSAVVTAPAAENQKTEPQKETTPAAEQNPPTVTFTPVAPFVPIEDPEENFKQLAAHVKACADSVGATEEKLVQFAIKNKMSGKSVKKILEISGASLATIANSYQVDPLKWRDTVNAA